jgi:hypothetical protein
MITRTTRTGRSRRAGMAALLAAPALIFALAACAPATGDASGGSTSGGSTSGGSASDGSGGTLADWQLAYAECMRGEGIDMPDPEGPGQGISIDGNGDMAAFDQASEKCMTELGDPPAMSAEEKAAMDAQNMEAMREIASCYRENGYEMPDPKAGEAPQFPEDAPQEVVQDCGGGAPSVTKRIDG